MTDSAASIILYNPRAASPGHQRLPLSLLQLGGFLEDRLPYEIVDGNLLQEDEAVETLVGKLAAVRSACLAVTVMPGPQLQRTVRQLDLVRSRCPHATVVVGGYFPSIYPDVCARHRSIDYVCVGPGERTLPELVECLQRGDGPGGVAGLVFEHGGEITRTPPREPEDPDALPLLPYHRVDVGAYVADTHLGRRTLSHHSSYGCPYRCSFCGVTAVCGGTWRAESASRTAEVTERLVREWQIDALEFHDNNFFVDERRVADYCRHLLDNDVHITWWGEGRVDTVLAFSDRTWQLMRDSGLAMIFMGAESGDDETLRRMNKGGTLSREKTVQLVKRMREYGVVPELSFVCGNPPDPESDARATIELVRDIKAVNPLTEIVLYRYDPVPLDGYMWDEVKARGFDPPTTLDEWASPYWEQVQRRRTVALPWLDDRVLRLIRDFETVLNAYYPTTTDARYRRRSWRLLLRLLSGWRYALRLYHRPGELRWLQRATRYQRPETTGF